MSMRQTRAKHHAVKKMKSCNKLSPESPTNKSIIVENFIEMLNTIKLYHWNTHSFSQHKATDELHERLSGHVDKFVETLLGKKESRVKHIQSKIPIVNAKHTHTFRDQIYQYREYLIGMDKCLDKSRDTDLLNIRDEILGDINQFLYLLTLN
jgi:DNA-binding ferritin-like protein